MYSLDVIYLIVLGLFAAIFGLVSPNFLLLLAGIAMAVFGFYQGKDKSPKVLDTSKFKRRFMTDNSMAYVAVNGSKKDQNYMYAYIAFALVTLLIATFSHNFLAKLSSGMLCFATVMIMFAWIMRGDTDVFWMPGESRPIRIFYNEDKFKAEEPKKDSDKEVIEPEVVKKEEKEGDEK